MDINRITSFNTRILAIWTGFGAILGLGFGIVGLVSGSWENANMLMLPLAILFGAVAYNVYGFLFLLLMAGTQYKFKFSAVRYSLWFWAIFPAFIIFALGFMLLWKVLKSAWRNS